MPSASDIAATPGWREDRAPLLDESISRRWSISAAVIVPMSLFVAFSVLFGALFWEQDQTAHAVKDATQTLSEALAPVSRHDAQRLGALPPDQSVRQLASDLLHVAKHVQQYPGDTVLARFDRVAADYSGAHATLLAYNRLPPGETPVSDALARLLANSQQGLPAGDDEAKSSTGSGQAAAGCMCEPAGVIFFPIDSDGLTPHARSQIRAAAERWKASASRQPIRVRGFADIGTGTLERNMELSLARAMAVADYLGTLIGSRKLVKAAKFDGQELPSYDGFNADDAEYQRVAIIELGG